MDTIANQINKKIFQINHSILNYQKDYLYCYKPVDLSVIDTIYNKNSTLNYINGNCDKMIKDIILNIKNPKEYIDKLEKIKNDVKQLRSEI